MVGDEGVAFGGEVDIAGFGEIFVVEIFGLGVEIVDGDVVFFHDGDGCCVISFIITCFASGFACGDVCRCGEDEFGVCFFESDD